MAEPSALEQNYPTTQPNRSYNDFTQIEQQIANSEDGRNYAELRARIEALEAAMGTVAPGLAQAQTDIDTLEDDKVSKESNKELMPSNLPLEVANNTQSIENITTAMDGKVDKEEGKELMPSTLPGVVENQGIQVEGIVSDIEALDREKQDQMQFKVMPTATADWLGLAVQYIGPTTETYKNNYFYQCGYNEETLEYEWQQKDVQPQGEVDLSEFYTKTETNNLLQGKQDTLTAGDGIKIQGTTIMQNILDDTISSAQTTWSSRYIESLFHSLAGLSAIEIVDARPAVPVNNTLYYVKAFEEGEEPLYEIWFYQNNTWTKFGTTSIDLTNYYTKAEVDALLANKQGTLTEGTGIRISNNNVEVKIDGTTIKVNSAGNLYVEGGGGGGGKTYYSGPGVTVDNDNNIIQANVDGTSVEVVQDKIQIKEVGSEKVLVDGTDPENKVYLPAKITEIENDIGQNATDIASLNTNKADKGSSYTKTEEDNLLNGKADKSTTYTKTETDTLLNAKLSATDVDRGLSIVNNKVGISNSITAQNTQGLYPITMDARGLVTGYGTKQTPSDTYTSGANNQLLTRNGAAALWKRVPKYCGILTRGSAQTFSLNAWTNVALTSIDSSSDTSYVTLTSNGAKILKTGIYQIDITCRLTDSISSATAVEWAIGLTGHDDDSSGGAWYYTVHRHKATTTLNVYISANTVVYPRIYSVNGINTLNYCSMTITCLKES